jgi:cobalt-zinc-cadmium efflux system outer membrane protein
MIAAVILAVAALAPKQFAALPLDSAIEKAVAISPDVAQARERVTENAALLAAARGLAAPAITANYTQAPQGGSNNETITQRLATVGAQITLGDYLASSATVRQAYFTLAGAQFDLLDVQRAERIKTSGQYYNALKAYATVDLRRQDLAGATSDLRAANLRYGAGDAPKLDVVRAHVALANAQANLESAQVDLENAQEALAVETGEPVQVLSALSTASAPALLPAEPARAVARALAQRGDLAAAQQAVHAEEAAVKVAERGVLPAVTVSAGYTGGVDSGVAVHGPSATVNLVVPVSHAAADRAWAERARLAQAQDKAAAIRRQIVVSAAAAARTYAETQRATQAATRARIAAQEQLHATQVGYRSGASSSLDVADARRTYVQAALAELNAVYAQAQAAATLEEEIGP